MARAKIHSLIDLSCGSFVRVPPPPVLLAGEQQAFRPHVRSALRCVWGVSVPTELCRTQPLAIWCSAAARPGRLPPQVAHPHAELLPAGTRHLALSVDLITERSKEDFRKEMELLGALMVPFPPCGPGEKLYPGSFTWCQHGVLGLRGEGQSLLHRVRAELTPSCLL